MKMSLNNIKNYLIDRFNQRFANNKQKSDSNTQTIPPELTLKDLMMKLEPMFVSLQSLLIWDKPYQSAIAFFAFNCLYWLFVCLNRLRFYAFISIVFFLIHFFKLWTQYIWPEIRVPPNESTDTEGWTPVHPQVLSAPEINHYINELCVMSKALILWWVRLRREKPLKFFITTTTLLLMTAIIGRLVPGVIIVYTIMMTMALGPGIVLYVLPEGLYDFLKNIFNSKADEIDANPTISDISNDKIDDSDDLSAKERLSESALHQYLNSTQFSDFELNPFASNDSSLQLLSDTQLDTTLDKELGIEVQFNGEDLKLDSHSSKSSQSSKSSHSSHSSGAIRFVSTHFSRNSSSENIEDEFELISDSEILDFAKGSQTNRQTNI